MRIRRTPDVRAAKAMMLGERDLILLVEWLDPLGVLDAPRRLQPEVLPADAAARWLTALIRLT